MNARLVAVCLSAEKGQAKQAAPAGQLVADQGLRGDAHAGPGHRQVSLLSREAIERMQEKCGPLAWGAFGENLVSQGLDTADLGLGSRLRVGEKAVLEVTQIGKVCHHPCAIAQRAGECIMPREGLFLRVVEGGTVRASDALVVTDRVPPEIIQGAILTVSDRVARGEREDQAGPALSQLLSQRLGARVAATAVVPDEREAITEALRHFCERGGLDLVITSGGTGFGPRDVTPEATAEVVERHTPGLDEAMRAASLKVTPHGILSRGRSGICGRTLIVNVPGSPNAACENLEAILPALPHAIEVIRGSVVDCVPASANAGSKQCSDGDASNSRDH